MAFGSKSKGNHEAPTSLRPLESSKLCASSVSSKSYLEYLLVVECQKREHQVEEGEKSKNFIEISSQGQIH